MSTDHIQVTPAMAQYLRAISLRESEVLSALREHTQSLAVQGMQSLPEQAQFIHLLLRLMGAKRGIEVGVFTGYTSLWMAMALPDDGQLVALDVNDEWTRIAKDYWLQAAVSHKIDLRLQPALDSLDQMLREGEQGQFDFAYIDADKANYSAYYERCLQLVRQNGLLLIDNTLWKGRLLDKNDQKASTQAIRQLNQHLYTDARVELSVLPIGDGLTMLIKR